MLFAQTQLVSELTKASLSSQQTSTQPFTPRHSSILSFLQNYRHLLKWQSNARNAAHAEVTKSLSLMTHCMYLPTPHSSNHPQHYWKLQNWRFQYFDLRSRLRTGSLPFKAPQRTTPERLITLASRHERGLLLYDNCSITSLRRFIKCRNLTIPPEQMEYRNLNKETLIRWLEDADEKATFSHLVDLPAELRLQVYDHAFKDFSLQGTLPQPPLCRVSRLLRAESLPVFFARVRVEIAIMLDFYTASGELVIKSEGLFRHATEEMLASIAKLKVRCLGFGGVIVWKVNLARSEKDVAIRVMAGHRNPELVEEKQVWLRAWLEGMRCEDGGMRLRRKDGQKLVEVL